MLIEGLKAPQEINHQRPWIRFFARWTDMAVFQFFLLMLNIEFSFVVYISIYGWIFIEAILLSVWGTTLGKWLLGTTVRDIRGNKLTYQSALARSFEVLLKGLALGIPIVHFITLIISYNQLTGNWGKTSWDLNGGYQVKHKKINPLGAIVVIIIVSCWILFPLYTFFAHN